MQKFADTYRTDPEFKQKADEAMQRLLTRSATDMDFRHALLNDPRGAMSEFTGRQVPESVNFRFIENKADVTFVLPDAVDHDVELSETELEAVAGGVVPYLAYVAATAIVAFAAGYSSEK